MEDDYNEYLDLPDDPLEGFAALHKKLNKGVKDSHNTSQSDEAMRNYAEVLLMYNKVHGLGVLDLYDEIPLRFDKEFYEYFQRISGAARRETQRILIETAKRQKSAGQTSIVSLDSTTRTSIHELIASLKGKLNELNIAEAKRESLFNKLNAFAAEVDRNRTKTEAFMAFAVELSRAAKEVSENINPLQQTIDRILDLIEKAKNVGGFLPRRTEPKQLSAPKDEPPSSIEDNCQTED